MHSAGLNLRSAGALAFAVLLSAAFAPWVAGGASSARQGGQSEDSSAQVTDMTVVVREGKSPLLLVLDGERRAVSSHELTDASPARLGPGNFAPFFSSPALRRPTALAYSGGKLYVADRGAQAVFAVNVESLEITEVLGRPHLSAPVSVAVSDEGVLAVGDDDLDDVVLAAPDSEPRRLGLKLDDPDRLNFVGRDLLVLETEEGVVTLSPAGATPWRTQELKTVNSLLRGERRNGTGTGLTESFVGGGKRIRDFTVYKGVYYVAGRDRVVAFMPNSSHKDVPVFQKEQAGASLSHVAVSPQHLLISEADGGVVRKLPRPVPVSVSFGVDVRVSQREVLERQHLALASLYEYLDARGMLRRREVTAARDYATPLELLRDEGALTNWLPREGAGQRSEPAEKRLAALLFKLNGWDKSCKGCPVERPIRKGESVLIPDVPIEKTVTASDVPLGPKTVREHLAERVAPEHSAQVSADYLLALNLKYLLSLEAVVTRENLIPVSNPATALRPGTVIRFDGGKEVPVGNLSQCSVGLAARITQKEVPTLSGVSSEPVTATLPRAEPAEVGEALRAKLKSLKEVFIGFEGLVEETIARSDLNAALESTANDPQCSSLLATPNVYVVTSARRAAGAKYRLIGGDGESRFLSESEMARLSLKGEIDKTKEWSFIVSEPVYLGYTLARVNPLTESLTWESIREASAVKPEGVFDILSSKNRVLKLPATVWRLSLFVHAPDLKVSTPELADVANAPGVDLLSEEIPDANRHGHVALPVTARQVAQPDPQAERQSILDNRRKLLDDIKYVPPVPQISAVVVGVGESANSVHKDHPAFADKDGSAWFEKSGLTLVPRTRPLGDAAQPSQRLIKKFETDIDHGDHVAGLIAARGDIAPGLVKGAGLYLIDNSSAAALGKSIDEALALAPSVEIFNFSFDIPGHSADKSQQALLRNMTERWYSAVFVVSAGNDGENVEKLLERLPISWADRVKNIIGVAAAQGENLVGDILPGPGSVLSQKGSNYGEKYVHLAAPGRDLFSVASDNSYAAATGTSQAAPIVTAAAAMLYAQKISAPWAIKARLVYTSDWVAQMETKVWGGLLNYRRAVWQPNENLLRLHSAPDTVSAFKFRDGTLTVGEESDAFDGRGEAIARPASLRFSDILRIERVAGGKLRVIYLERLKAQRKIRVLRNASLDSDVVCEKVQDWDQTRGQFNPDGQCQRNFKAGEILEYVAATPTVAISF